MFNPSLKWDELQALKFVWLALQYWVKSFPHKGEPMDIEFEALDIKRHRRDRTRFTVAGLISVMSLPATRFAFMEVPTCDTRAECKYTPHHVILKDGTVRLSGKFPPLHIRRVLIRTADEWSLGPRWVVGKFVPRHDGSRLSKSLIARLAG